MAAFLSASSMMKELVSFAVQMLPQDAFYLATLPNYPDSYPVARIYALFSNLDPFLKSRAYFLRWELAKMEDSCILGYQWGEEQFWVDPSKVAKVLHRLGILGAEGCVKVSYNLRLLGGHETAQASYFSLSERWGRDAKGGWICYVNGMGTSESDASRDATYLSDQLACRNNIHCVYLPTRQNAPMGDVAGFTLDALRYVAVDLGAHTRASCLIVQQWIDYFTREPEKGLLQVCHSEGAAHVNAALRILRATRPDFIHRLSIITFCPARIITPLLGEPLQVINLFKWEDPIPTYLAGGLQAAQEFQLYVRIVPHTGGWPHNHVTDDYVRIAQPYFDQFMRTGSLNLSQ